MEKVKIAVVGLGNIGTLHLGNIENEPKVELTAVCDIVPEKAKAVAEKYGVKAYFDSDTLLSDHVCDAVIIGTPHYFHTTIGIAAMDSGHHVLVEKPISVHKADCERLIAAHARNKDMVFAAMFNQRTDPHYQKIRDIVQSGELGRLMRINWIITNWFRTQAYYDSGGWRATWGGEGGGVLLNQCPHNLDLLQWICGMPERIRGFCDIGKRHNIEVEDEVTAFMEYHGGCTGLFVTSTGEAPGTNRLEIAGDRGKLVYENGQISYTRNEVSATDFLNTCPESFARPPVWDITIPVRGHGGEHAAVLSNFADAIINGTPLIAPAEEGINSVELANAMLYSSLKGCTIDLPLDSAEYEAELKKLIAGSTFAKKTVEQTVYDMGKSFNR
ncbi:MAG: Gfo/Idh/MocA family oxidoreductase [Anaerolineales bacterium]|nr:MAG: Gfo/Idh/MocA family oxidoreductase [Anaerolineales bacterium]